MASKEINYIEIRCWYPFQKRYLFLDQQEGNLSSSAFNNFNVNPIVEQIMTAKREKYAIKFIRIASWKQAQFRRAMEKLRNNMILCGYQDYADRSREIIGNIKTEALK